MEKIKTGLLAAAFICLLVLNGSSFVPRLRTTSNHPVGEDVVLATPFKPNADLRSVPVVETSGGTPVATGQRVHVFLNYAYEDSLNQGRPRLSTWILLGFGALYGLASLFTRKKA